MLKRHIVYLIVVNFDIFWTERGGEAAESGGRMDGDILHKHFRGGLGIRRWFWVRRMGKYGQLRSPDRHFWSLHQMLPMPSQALIFTNLSFKKEGFI